MQFKQQKTSDIGTLADFYASLNELRNCLSRILLNLIGKMNARCPRERNGNRRVFRTTTEPIITAADIEDGFNFFIAAGGNTITTEAGRQWCTSTGNASGTF